MKEEDLIYSLSRLDADIIEDADPSIAIGREAETTQHPMSGMAVAALVFVSVLVLGGGIALAMNSVAIREFFFHKSEEEFKQVYTEVGKEYNLGKYKLIFDGYVYEKAVHQGFLNFSVWDKEGKPVDKETLRKYRLKMMGLPNRMLSERFLDAYQIKIGTDEIYFVTVYNNGLFTFPENNHLYIEFSRLDSDENGKGYYSDGEFSFLVFDKEQWEDFYADIGALNQEELCPISYDKENDKMIYDFDQNALLPEVVEIINKYNPYSLKSITYATQVIEVGGVKCTVGRTNMLMEYNTNDCDLGDFVLKRADGTELNLFKQEEFYKNGNGGKDFHSIIWRPEDPKSYNTGIGGVDNTTGDSQYGFNYGFILEPDEKITIETDGQIYE